MNSWASFPESSAAELDPSEKRSRPPNRIRRGSSARVLTLFSRLSRHETTAGSHRQQEKAKVTDRSSLTDFVMCDLAKSLYCRSYRMKLIESAPLDLVDDVLAILVVVLF